MQPMEKKYREADLLIFDQMQKVDHTVDLNWVGYPIRMDVLQIKIQ